MATCALIHATNRSGAAIRPTLAALSRPRKNCQAGAAKREKKPPFPKALADQARAVRAALVAYPRPATGDELAQSFTGARADRVGELLETLASLGQARKVEAGRYVA